jgi:hypothetical protein
MSRPVPEIEALVEAAHQLVDDYRACAAVVAHQDALRLLQAVDAAVSAAERARRRFSPGAHDHARRALQRARELMAEARLRPAQD